MKPLSQSIGSLIALCFLAGPVWAWGYPMSSRAMSIWRHPVVTFGWTPYDVYDQGMGNVAGSPGFIPGYGYYPGIWPSRYPWMDGPGTPFDRRKIAPPVVEETPTPPDAALLIVKIPAEAELWIDDVKTSQGGSYREFRTPTLPADGASTYTLRAVWRIKDAELTRVEKVQVQPGKRQIINFLTTDSWTGQRIESLPPPRKVP
jgi:uncharacterized protein (TIGR03000 family)